ncbi:uncharacterized protein N7458_001526 [Penicillium daleae]|uniref:RING-type E3 ubiquitin transferase n=1 Tax=Penicillium daleae TaxID=63821 RepID=A0AAD6CB60_9EURO|nr:uncharacterized protein N7458_001526 [Penicillium daleae]KAJ5459974.1 hypothetical protein N7458_001526 [Penicillium daleae]
MFPNSSFLSSASPLPAFMAENGDLQQRILQKTLQEVADEEAEGADPCVICLDTITEPCVGVPCHHANFDYLCLLSWLEQQPNCPLCKANLTAVQYDVKGPRGPKTYTVPPVNARGTTVRAPLPHETRLRGQQRRRQRTRLHQPQPAPSDPLSVRRNVYRNQLYSLRVGSNRLSQYTEVTPEHFNRDEALVSRARKWIRRELQVFSFCIQRQRTHRKKGGTPFLALDSSDWSNGGQTMPSSCSSTLLPFYGRWISKVVLGKQKSCFAIFWGGKMLKTGIVMCNTRLRGLRPAIGRVEMRAIIAVAPPVGTQLVPVVHRRLMSAIEACLTGSQGPRVLSQAQDEGQYLGVGAQVDVPRGRSEIGIF